MIMTADFVNNRWQVKFVSLDVKIFLCHHRLSEFKTVEKYGQDIMEKINERNQIRRNGGNYSKVIWYVFRVQWITELRPQAEHVILLGA